jgi:UPF0716 protein FxsA
MAQPLRLAALLVFLAFPILEIGLLIRAGQMFGFWRLALIVVVTALLGTAVIRRTGLSVLTRARAHIERGRSGFSPLFDGLVQLTAGMLLIFPGLISDVLGLILLIPAVRHILITSILPKLFPIATFTASRADNPFQRPRDEHGQHGSETTSEDPSDGDGVTIEGEYERVSEKTLSPERSLRPRPPRRSAN